MANHLKRLVEEYSQNSNDIGEYDSASKNSRLLAYLTFPLAIVYFTYVAIAVVTGAVEASLFLFSFFGGALILLPLLLSMMFFEWKADRYSFTEKEVLYHYLVNAISKFDDENYQSCLNSIKNLKNRSDFNRTNVLHREHKRFFDSYTSYLLSLENENEKIVELKKTFNEGVRPIAEELALIEYGRPEEITVSKPNVDIPHSSSDSSITNTSLEELLGSTILRQSLLFFVILVATIAFFVFNKDVGTFVAVTWLPVVIYYLRESKGKTT